MEKPMETKSINRRFVATTLFGAAGAAALVTISKVSTSQPHLEGAFLPWHVVAAVAIGRKTEYDSLVIVGLDGDF
jgi:hypothetical protein